MHFGPDGPDKIITRADLKASVQAYDDVCIPVPGAACALLRSLSRLCPPPF